MSIGLIDSRPQTVQRNVPNPRAHSRSWLRAMFNGARLRCPSCGEGRLYEEGLKAVNFCSHCEEELYHHRASRMAPWISAFLAAHVALITAAFVNWLFAPSLLWLALPALPLWAGLTLLMLPSVKGAVIGVQWATRLHGFQYAAMCKPRHPRSHKA